MMLRPVVHEIPFPRQPTEHDSFIDALTPSELHAQARCQSVKTPVVVSVDMWGAVVLEDGQLL